MRGMRDLIDECEELRRRCHSLLAEKNDAVGAAERVRGFLMARDLEVAELKQQVAGLEKEIERSHMELDELEDDRHMRMARHELLRERMDAGSEVRAEQAGKEAYSGWRELPVATERLGEAKVEYFADGRIKWSSGQIPPDAKQARMHIQGADELQEGLQREALKNWTPNRAYQPDQPLPDLPKAKRPWWLVW